jgi:hypothetical protein
VDVEYFNFSKQMVSEQVKADVDAFFERTEKGQGFEAVSEFVEAGATFASDALPQISILSDYVNWMKGLANVTMPGCSYDLHSATTNENTVVYFATFHGIHTGPGGPVEPTGKSLSTRYVYIVSVGESGKITGMIKVWNAPDAFKQLGWA